VSLNAEETDVPDAESNVSLDCVSRLTFVLFFFGGLTVGADSSKFVG
jgi:hypothetical protein